MHPWTEDLGAPNPAQLSKAVALGVERHLGVSEPLNSWGLLGWPSLGCYLWSRASPNVLISGIDNWFYAHFDWCSNQLWVCFKIYNWSVVIASDNILLWRYLGVVWCKKCYHSPINFLLWLRAYIRVKTKMENHISMVLTCSFQGSQLMFKPCLQPVCDSCPLVDVYIAIENCHLVCWFSKNGWICQFVL